MHTLCFSWGFNVFGQLGLDDFQTRDCPVSIPFNYDTSGYIIDIAAGAHHSMLLTNTNKLFHLWLCR